MDLSQLKSQLEWKDSETIKIKGATSWLELKNFAQLKGRRVMTSPTEEYAGVLAGLATSCTGEHAFGYGTLRDQVESCRFINYAGERMLLEKNQSIKSCGLDHLLIEDYLKCYERYRFFKNAPFPRLQQATDLMIGSEGQLGVITEAVVKTALLEPSDYYFILVPRWELNCSAHIEIVHKIQNYRGKVLTVELVDWNSLACLPKTEWNQKVNHDVIFMEVLCKYSEEIFENLIADMESISMDDVFSFDEIRFNRLRKAVPRFINEMNSRKGIIKTGTDVQVSVAEIEHLFAYYQEFTKVGIKYNLFGHLGDAHLHFNFLPDHEQTKKCDDLLQTFYKEISFWNASPFAEHGIGLIKQKHMHNFWNETILSMFKHCKEIFDPKGIFFPQGYMGTKH